MGSNSLPVCYEDSIVSDVEVVHEEVVLVNEALLALVGPHGTHALKSLFKVRVNRRTLYRLQSLRMPAGRDVNPLKGNVTSLYI